MSEVCLDNELKVRVSQSKDGRKKKIQIKNDFMDIKIRVKDRDIDWGFCEWDERPLAGRRLGELIGATGTDLKPASAVVAVKEL